MKYHLVTYFTTTHLSKKTIELLGDDRFTFEVVTPHDGDGIQVDMHDGSMIVLSYEDVGITREILQYC